jgi:acyl carrier protein
METGLLDSLALVELIVEIEQQFGIQIPLEEIEIDHFRSVVRIAEFVGHRKSHNSSIHK